MKSDDESSGTDESTAGSPVRVRHAWSASDRPSTAVTEAVAATTGRKPATMPPLYEYIDPDALNAVLTSRTNDSANAVAVSFTYGGVTVRIDSGGWIEVQSDSVSRE